MTPSEHLLVLFSIVLGLGIAELLSSLHHLLHPKTRAHWDWLPVFWAAETFLVMVFWWWSMFQLGQLETLPNFFGVVLMLMAPAMLYLVATSALPDIIPGDVVDLRAFYVSNRFRFFGLLAGYTGVMWLQILLFRWDQPIGQHVSIGASIVLLSILALTANRRVHVVLTAASGMMFVVAVAAYWFRLE